MRARAYHHGDLRSALLAEAQSTLRTSGLDGLSLRELARAVGVSHAAPRRHFPDKAALLEALVADGFQRLGSALEAAVDSERREFDDVLDEVALAYVRFATANPPLTDLMSQSRFLSDASEQLVVAREASFAPVRKMVEAGQAAGVFAQGDTVRLGTVIFGMLHGLASMVNNGMVDPTDEDLTHDAARILLRGLRSGS